MKCKDFGRSAHSLFEDTIPAWLGRSEKKNKKLYS
jgi:hypothetical protein